MSATARRSSAARAMTSSAVRKRASQVAAAAQPSSMRIATGELACVAASGGCHNGPAAATITRPASVSRIKVSHHGVRAGVSSLGAISNSSRVGGKSMRRGRGGIMRSSHHSTGSVNSPISTSGSAKPSGRPPIMPASSTRWRRAPVPQAPPWPRRCGHAVRARVRSAGGQCGEWQNSSRAGRSRCGFHRDGV